MMSDSINIEFGTKAETLLRLNIAYPDLHIPYMFSFSMGEWKHNRCDVLSSIMTTFKNVPAIAIRSSCKMEDGASESNAGAFESILDVKTCDPIAIENAIETVFKSYNNEDVEDQILVQPMVNDIHVSGVIMTRILDDGSPYYTIDYDDESGRTDTVTGGTGVSKTLYVFRGVKDIDFDSPRVALMVSLARRLEKIFNNNALDIEFGIDSKGTIHLFQVRRICISGNWTKGVQARVSSSLVFVEEFINRHFKPKPGLHGARSILGIMPDWNPAEIIGITARPLATSLYRNLITSRVWSLAREKMGYREMPPVELMVLVAGRPYIDVRASFNSFLPAGVDSQLGETLVNAWLDRLDAHPHFHDKVEFEILTTMVDLNFENNFKSKYNGLLSNDDFRTYREHLLTLTNKNLNLSEDGTLSQAKSTADMLAERQKNRPLNLDATHNDTVVSQIEKLAEECRNYGTLPFSILARHGFMAESLLRSAVERGALSPDRVQAFKRSVQTISGEMSDDFYAVCYNAMDINSFMLKYGHLRPGTYDILSPKYADRTDIFNSNGMSAQKISRSSFKPTPRELTELNMLLKEAGITSINSEGLFKYAEKAIAGREYGKFIFSKDLSNVIDLISCWGEATGLDRETVSFLDLKDILETAVTPVLNNTSDHFQALAEKGKARYSLGRSLKLSYLIRSSRDIYIVPVHRSAPNFISSGKVEAEVCVLNGKADSNINMNGKIICIENADPGYDWIFTRNIKGVITKFGGINSHMAIRCAEFGLPAAIGCGERIFHLVATHKRCEIDSASELLRPL